jgi:hypothetical protein
MTRNRILLAILALAAIWLLADPCAPDKPKPPEKLAS